LRKAHAISSDELAADSSPRIEASAAAPKLLHHLGHGPVADPLAIGKAASARNGCVLQRAQELIHQARLANTGGAENREQVAEALADDVRERVLEELALAIAAHHRRGVPPRYRRRCDGDQAKGRHRLGLSLRLQRFDRLDLNSVADEAQCLLAEQDLTGLRCLLQAGCDVHCVPGCEAFLRAGDDLTRVHAHAQLEPGPVRALELLVQAGETSAQLVSSAHRPEGVVLVKGRHTEDGHDRIADELLDGASVPLHDRLRGLEVTTHDAPQALRVDPLAERGRARDVAEEDGYGLAHLAHGCGLAEQRPAGIAKARAQAILRTATHANHHGASLGRSNRRRFPSPAAQRDLSKPNRGPRRGSSIPGVSSERFSSGSRQAANRLDQWFPKPRAHVRFMPGASAHTGFRLLAPPRVFPQPPTRPLIVLTGRVSATDPDTSGQGRVNEPDGRMG